VADEGPDVRVEHQVDPSTTLFSCMQPRDCPSLTTGKSIDLGLRPLDHTECKWVDENYLQISREHTHPGGILPRIAFCTDIATTNRTQHSIQIS